MQHTEQIHSKAEVCIFLSKHKVKTAGLFDEKEGFSCLTAIFGTFS